MLDRSLPVKSNPGHEPPFDNNIDRHTLAIYASSMKSRRVHRRDKGGEEKYEIHEPAKEGQKDEASTQTREREGRGVERRGRGGGAMSDGLSIEPTRLLDWDNCVGG